MLLEALRDATHIWKHLPDFRFGRPEQHRLAVPRDAPLKGIYAPHFHTLVDIVATFEEETSFGNIGWLDLGVRLVGCCLYRYGPTIVSGIHDVHI